MDFFSAQFLFFVQTLLFASVIFMHLSKKSASVIFLYQVQSLIVACLLLGSALAESAIFPLFVAVVVCAVKVVIAPHFFRRLTRELQLKFSASTYLSGPLTLIILAALTAFTYSHFFAPLSTLNASNARALLLAAAMMLAALFLIVNRKGALSQMIGILSLENAIVAFAFLSGLEQSPALELGVLFDILMWIIIATVFASMVYRQFGSLDVTAMNSLKEE
ncbi:MAG: Hydrogenase 4 membrane component [Candidatus Magasanikbacteria bacterium GW2011_GWA2_56_11]|uniref:Hydrogenase 4 membrane component n=1 Tax=Candidatus Magasanikbacteria bacterium GW2011_GWA2_56_11 TaxID=1619044 RepID=A0A0G2BAG6_9BACT|nr:MAG: Hydrogenase 4 membrane component [Candidatus Magasanikbacteria bacterium GW2011_GWA2_56_11]